MVTPLFGGETGNMGSRVVAIWIFFGWKYETSLARRFFVVSEGEGSRVAYLLLPERQGLSGRSPC